MLIDIFAQPNLYIVDVVITRKIPTIKMGQPTYITVIKKFHKHPALLNDSQFPSDTYKNKWIRKYWEMSDDIFKKSTFEVKFEDIKFSSKITYDFMDF